MHVCWRTAGRIITSIDLLNSEWRGDWPTYTTVPSCVHRHLSWSIQRNTGQSYLSLMKTSKNTTSRNHCCVLQCVCPLASNACSFPLRLYALFKQFFAEDAAASNGKGARTPPARPIPGMLAFGRWSPYISNCAVTTHEYTEYLILDISDNYNMR